MRQQLRRVVIRTAVLLLASTRPASPLGGTVDAGLLDGPVAAVEGLAWQGLEVRASLDGTGVLHVSERLSLAVGGDVTFVERTFRRFVQMEVTVASIARLDAASGAWQKLSPGALDAADRYEVEDATLRWSLRGPADPAFGATTILTYEINYDVAGAVIPAWGVRAFGSATILGPFALHPLRRTAELQQAWRLAPGGWTTRFVLDFDFSPFPFLGGAPIERFSLDLRVDRAWRLLARPGGARTGISASEDLRDFLPLEFIGPGRPAAVVRGPHIAWVASLLALPVLLPALAAWRLAGAITRKRRYNRTPVDESWIRQHVLTRSPKEIRRLAQEIEGEFRFPGVPALLAEMERDGKIVLDGPPETGTLRQIAGSDALPPWERLLAAALFGDTGAVRADEVRQRSRIALRETERSVRDAYDNAYRRGLSPALVGRRYLPAALIAVGILLTLSALAGGGFQALALGLILGSVVHGQVGPRVRLFARSLDLPTRSVSLLIAPAVLFPLAAIAFFLTVPAYPRVVVGLVTFWAGLMLLMVDAAWPRWSEADIEARYGLSRAIGYISAELDKPRPALDDDWLPWIQALGLHDAVERWRGGRGMFASKTPDADASGTARWTGGTESGIRAETWVERFLYGSGA